jgi:dTDP-glucose 4,6-dehydratase
MTGLIKKAGSHSIVVKTPGKLVKLMLGMLGSIGIELLYKEQFEIADEQYIVDISNASSEIGWKPKMSDLAMINEAYVQYKKKH